MKKILYMPLDERPCNYNFPILLSEGTEYTMVVPPVEMLGDKKTPANCEGLWKWFDENAKGAYGAIVSIDMLVYGGIIPSRLHYLKADECREKLKGLKRIKASNPDMKIFAFNLIMRCPSYSSSDEEPDYYEDYGKEIFRKAYIEHKTSLGIVDDEEKKELDEISKKLPDEILNDYIDRRKINMEVNKESINYVKDGTIDFMVVPQDDSAPYGLTAIDQQSVRNYIIKNDLSLKVYMYPGADEVGCTLLARMINEDKSLKPMVYVRYSSVVGPNVIPLFEDRILAESVKYHVLCAGGLITTSLSEADVVLMINSPGEIMMEADEQNIMNISYNVQRNLPEFVEYIDYVVNNCNKTCIIADVAYTNGADLELISLLRQKNLLFKAAAYAGWNTSSNTLGTCILQGMIYNIYGKSIHHNNFLALRYVEDAGYCGYVRQFVCNEKLDELGLNYFKADGRRGKVSEIVKEELEKFIQSRLKNDEYEIIIDDCYMPWRRMFEVGLKVRVNKI